MTTLKTAVLAPIPSASVSIAIVVNDGFLRRPRAAKRRYLQDHFQDPARAFVSHPLLELIASTYFHRCLPSRVGLRRSLGGLFINQVVEVGLDLIVQVALDGFSAEDVSEESTDAKHGLLRTSLRWLLR